MRLAELKA